MKYFARLIITLLVVIALDGFPLRSQSTQYQTFAFNDFAVQVLSPYQKIHINQKNVDLFKEAVQKHLESEGLRLQQDPDFLVNIGMTIEQEVQTRDPATNEVPYAAPYTPSEKALDYYWYEVIVGVYKIGTIDIELVDAEHQTMVWQGSRTTVLWKNKEKKIRRKINNSIDRIMAKFNASKLGI